MDPVFSSYFLFVSVACSQSLAQLKKIVKQETLMWQDHLHAVSTSKGSVMDARVHEGGVVLTRVPQIPSFCIQRMPWN